MTTRRPNVQMPGYSPELAKLTYWDGLQAKALEVAAFVDELLAAMMSRPKMYASLPSIELVVIHLLNVRDTALGRSGGARNEFLKFISKRVRPGNNGLYHRLRDQYDDDIAARGLDEHALDAEFEQEFIGTLGGFILNYREKTDVT